MLASHLIIGHDERRSLGLALDTRGERLRGLSEQVRTYLLHI